MGHEPPVQPDPEGAAAFYGALFGWTTETFGEGDAAMTMFRLPGYVGGEPRQPVSREVVATMSGASGDGAPGWSVNLWDVDVDASAAKAVELGGRAVAAPFDTPIEPDGGARRPARARPSRSPTCRASAPCSIISRLMDVDAAIAPDLSHPVADVLRERAASALGCRVRAATRTAWRSCSRAAACAASSRRAWPRRSSASG